MSRYIDYDAINYRHDKLHDKSDEFLNGVVYMAQRIEEAPSIDIVFCRDCEYKRLYDEGDTKYYYCALEDRPNRQWSVDDTDFCSYGERREP